MRKAPIILPSQYSAHDNHNSRRTWVGAKCRHGLLSCRLRVQVPGLVRLLVGLEAAVERDVILSGYGLAVENEEGGDVVLLPEIQVVIDVCFDASQAAERRQERFVGGSIVEELVEVVGRIDGKGALFELGNAVRAVT